MDINKTLDKSLLDLALRSYTNEHLNIMSQTSTTEIFPAEVEKLLFDSTDGS
jgi:hypothetical protein